MLLLIGIACIILLLFLLFAILVRKRRGRRFVCCPIPSPTPTPVSPTGPTGEPGNPATLPDDLTIKGNLTVNGTSLLNGLVTTNNGIINTSGNIQSTNGRVIAGTGFQVPSGANHFFISPTGPLPPGERILSLRDVGANSDIALGIDRTVDLRTVLVGNSYTATLQDSGTTFLVQSLPAGTNTFLLPNPTVAATNGLGVHYRFITGLMDNALEIRSDGFEQMYGTVVGASGVSQPGIAQVFSFAGTGANPAASVFELKASSTPGDFYDLYLGDVEPGATDARWMIRGQTTEVTSFGFTPFT